MWYTNSYRRHLCDMHIDDWDDSFLSKFSPEVYVDNLKTAHVQNAMLYFQSHVGLCYYPTKVGVMYKSFREREDLMKKTEELCHENGIDVTGYYSLNYNTVEHDRHPKWRMVKNLGISQREMLGAKSESGEALAFASLHGGRYGFCCPNSLEYREFVYEQIDEMLDYFKVEGMFFDMPFWPHTCFCDNCRARWEKEENIPFITEEPTPGSRAHLVLMRKKYEWMGEWIQSVTDYVKGRAPHVSVEHNFASGIAGNSNNGCAEEVNRACDFSGGDLYGGILNHSLACKFYKNITKNAPFDYMFSRCKPALRSHTLTKSEDEMMLEVLLTAAHHGATMVIDAIDPIGTLDHRVYERIGKIFSKEASYEQYFTGDMIEDIGVYYGIKSRYGSENTGFDAKDGCIGASKALISSHIPFGVTGSFYSLDKYRVIAAPMISMQEGDEQRILDYVAGGGCLYFSGDNAALIKALIGADNIGYTVEKNVYIAPTPENEELFLEFNESYPLPFDASAARITNVENGRVLAYLKLPYTRPDEIRFSSIHSNPPGILTEYPAVVEGEYGKGRFIWSSLPIEAVDMDEYRAVFIALIRRLVPDMKPSFVTSAASDVEITLFEDDDAFYVNVTHLDERTVMPTLQPFEIGIKYASVPSGVELLPSETPVQFEKRGEYVYFKTLPLHVFDMYKIIK